MSTGYVGVVVVVLMGAAVVSGASPRGPAAAVIENPAAAAPWATTRVEDSMSPAGVGVARAEPVRVPRPGWQWPIQPPPEVMRRFAVGPAPWSPGHRGVDLLAAEGVPVRASGAGLVSFAGMVAGRPVITVMHQGPSSGSALRTTYEPVRANVAVGAQVAAGQVIGTLTAGNATPNGNTTVSHCAPRVCLHWGAIRGHTYVDPLLLLRFRRPILLPWHE